MAFRHQHEASVTTEATVSTNYLSNIVGVAVLSRVSMNYLSNF